MLEYVIHSKDILNFVTFLKPLCEKITYAVPKVSLKFQNKQLIKISSSVFQYWFDNITICEKIEENRGNKEYQLPADELSNTLQVKYFDVVFTLLEEHSKLQNIKHDIAIDQFLQSRSKYVAKFGFRSEIDILLGYIIAYWDKNDEHYYNYKMKMIEDEHSSSFFKILFSIIEIDDFAEFEKTYLLNRERLEKRITTLEEFIWEILLAAILHNRTDIISFILKSESLSRVLISFPVNMRCNETTKWFANEMLNNGYEIGENSIPHQWITSDMFKKFLDARINYNKKNLIEIDTSFLLPNHITKYQVKNLKDVDNRLLFFNGETSLEYIMNNEYLKGFIVHPTIATYIDLKMHKFQSIYWWNFCFFLIVVLTHGCLVSSYFFRHEWFSIFFGISCFSLVCFF